MSNWRYKLATYMSGRRGVDQYSKFLMIVSAICLVLSMFIFEGFLYMIGLILLVYAYARIMSRNLTKRQMENLKYLQVKSKIMRRAGNYKEIYDETKYYRFFKCKNCGQNCRVPKNKGKIRITCPKCGHVFEKRT